MPDTATADIAPLDLPNVARPQPGAIDVRDKNGVRQKLGRKLKAALDGMVWEGLPFHVAAQKANFSVRAMRCALERSHVRRYLQQQKQVFTANIAAANIHRAAAIRDQDDNRTAALQAVRFLEEAATGRTANEGARVSAPGIVINIGAAATARSLPDDTLIEINPLSETGPNADDTQR